MSNEEIRVPELRFKGFYDDWEQRLIKNIAEIRTGPFGSILHASDYVENGIPIITTEHFKKGSLPTSKNGIPQVSDDDYLRLNSYILEAGDIVFSRVGSIDKNALITDDQDGWLFSGRVLRARTFTNIQSDFLHYLLDTTKVKRSIISRAVGQTMPSINTEILKKTPLKLTTDKNEQLKISKFLDKIDLSITLHQRKINTLEQLKKSFLSEFFPIKGDNTPNISFNGSKKNWVQYKLGELGKTKSGIGFPDIEQKGTEGVPFYKVSDMNSIGNENEMTSANNYVNEEQIRRNKWSPIDNVPAIMFAKVGAAIMLNRKRLLREPFLIDNNTMAYLFDESWDTNFGKTLFDTINLPRYAQVGALPSYNGSDIESIKILIPNKDEQYKIGRFFQNINIMISLHHNKLERLLKLKVLYLTKMFI